MKTRSNKLFIIFACLFAFSLLPYSLSEKCLQKYAASTPQQASNQPADIDFGPYMAILQRKIKKVWLCPKGCEDKRVVVKFNIHSDGRVSELELDRSSGVKIADQAALNAINEAAPFNPLPAGANDPIGIQFTFDHNVFFPKN